MKRLAQDPSRCSKRNKSKPANWEVCILSHEKVFLWPSGGVGWGELVVPQKTHGKRSGNTESRQTLHGQLLDSIRCAEDGQIGGPFKETRASPIPPRLPLRSSKGDLKRFLGEPALREQTHLGCSRGLGPFSLFPYPGWE